MLNTKESFINPARINVEALRPDSIGVTLAIVGIDPGRNGENVVDPSIWTVKERKTKPETEKTEGQISLPGETRKIGEGLMPNVIGALSEFTDDSFDIRHNLFFVKESSFVQAKVSIKGNPVDIVVLMYVGNLDKAFKPVDQEDVLPHKWMTIAEIRQSMQENPEGIRKFAREIIEMERSDRSVGKAVDEYFHNPMRRVPISALLPQNFSINQFHVQRERNADIKIWDNTVSAK